MARLDVTVAVEDRAASPWDHSWIVFW